MISLWSLWGKMNDSRPCFHPYNSGHTDKSNNWNQDGPPITNISIIVIHPMPCPWHSPQSTRATTTTITPALYHLLIHGSVPIVPTRMLTFKTSVAQCVVKKIFHKTNDHSSCEASHGYRLVAAPLVIPRRVPIVIVTSGKTKKYNGGNKSNEKWRKWQKQDCLQGNSLWRIMTTAMTWMDPKSVHSLHPLRSSLILLLQHVQTIPC
jgi:hypothetical protein